MATSPGPSHPTNEPPFAIVELTKEEHQFLLGHCDSNIAFGLASLQGLSEDNARRMVDILEQFKTLKKKLERSIL